MKENSTIVKPHIVENFTQDLMSKHTEEGQNITVTKVAPGVAQSNSSPYHTRIVGVPPTERKTI